MAAGAAIGVTVAGLFKLAEGADQLADKAGRIRDFGQQVGLTVAQVQALEIAGADVGLKAEKIAAGLGKLSAEMEQTRRGTGALFEEAQRINPELAEQLARARDLTQFIDRLSKAWDGLSESQRNALSKAALGRGIDLGRLFGQINEAGGLAALEQGLSKSIVLTNDQAKALDDLKDSAERLRTGAWDRFVSIFAESQLKAQLETAQGLDWISRSLKAISEIDIKQSVLELFGFVTGRSGGPAVKLPDELDALKAQLKAAEENRARLGPGRMGAIADATIAELRARIEAIERETQGAAADIPLPQPRPARARSSAVGGGTAQHRAPAHGAAWRRCHASRAAPTQDEGARGRDRRLVPQSERRQSSTGSLHPGPGPRGGSDPHAPGRCYRKKN